MNDSPPSGQPPVPPSEPPPGVEPPPPPTPPAPPTPPPPGGATPPPPVTGGDAYPTTLEVAYADRELDKTTTFFRIFVAIPILVILSAVAGSMSPRWHLAGTGGLIVFATALMIVVREKYPRWWFDFNLELTRFTTRVGVYLLAMNDEYPSTDEQQYVDLRIDYPDVRNDLNRYMPLIKWLLAVPHYIVLFFLGLGALVAAIYAWFVVLFTGRYPRDVFDFIVGVMRWHLRVLSYAVLLTTDEYPPFRFAP